MPDRNPRAARPRIEDYALIGDGETAALVARNGSIDWLCWPRFDSGSCFAAILGDESHGNWRIAPALDDVRVTRRYEPGTLVLETVFESADAAVSMLDLMPLRHSSSHVVRIVRGLRGRMPMRMDLRLRFDYGRSVPWVTRSGDGSLRAIAGPDMVILRCGPPVRGVDLATIAEFDVVAGESVPFVLSYSPSHIEPEQLGDPERALERTRAFWSEWTEQCTYEGEYREHVERSLITLKALIYQPTGGVVAAPTTSLPEKIGGPRNWDYRFCWLRDATFTLLALMDAGYMAEAEAWRTWLLRAAAGSPAQLQIMYGLAGERRLDEWTVPWLPGHADSGPVRIGNAAHGQLQLDVFGEVLDALYHAREAGLEGSVDAWNLQRALVCHLETVWDRPDEGIWEVRGGPQHFTHSKVMAWVALDRAIKGAEQFSLGAPLARWKELRARIQREVCEHGFDRSRNTFVQTFGGKALDASLLMLPLVGFLPADDPRMRGTVEAIERELTVDGFVLRYDTTETEDGLPPGEGAFLACSFWLVDNLILLGRLDDARALFERLLDIRNDVGLLAEEYDPVSRRFLGNFPQAFSHIGLIDSAFNLTRAAAPQQPRPAEQRAHAGLRAD